MPIQLSGSLVITGSITTTGVIIMSGSIASASYSSTSDLLQGTGSIGFTTTASFNAVSSSQQQISASYISLSASYNTFSGSASTRITVDSASLLQVSASQQQISASLLNVIAIGATTGSNSFRANQSITGSLVVSSTITAQTLIVQTVTSSIVYSSGSNIFGCDLNSRQTFTGSLYQTGSLASFSGQLCVGSSLVLGTNNAYALYLKDSAGNPKPVMATAGNTNLNFYNVCSTGKVNINNAADNAVLMSIDNTGAATFSGQLCSITGVFGTKGGGNYGVLISDNDQSNVRLKFTNTGTGGTSMSIVGGNPGLSNSGLAIYDETNAATRLYVSANGNVGIGTTSPDRKLDIACANASDTKLVIRTACGFAGSYSPSLDFHVGGYESTCTTGQIKMCGTNNYSGDMIFSTQLSGTINPLVERMRISCGGNVGIGTCSPYQNLTVLKNQNADTAAGIYNQTDGTASSTTLRLDNGSYNGQLNLYANLYTASGTAVANTLRLYTDGPGGMSFSATNQHIRFYTSPNECLRMTILYGGSVGMGNANPKHNLDICSVTTNAGGLAFCNMVTAQCVWSTFACVGTDSNIVTTITYTNTIDYNRSGVFVARWAYNDTCAALYIRSCLWNDSQNIGSFALRNNGGALQICLSGGGDSYRVQVLIQGSKAQ